MTIENNEPEITIFGADNCPRCRVTQDYLHRYSTSYTYIDVHTEEGVADKLRSQGFSSLPVVQTPTESWQGFRPDKLREYAARASLDAAPSTQDVSVSPVSPSVR